MDVYTNLYLDPEFNNALGLLFESFIRKRFNKGKSDIDFSILQRAGWVASILAESEIETHREKVQLFAFLIHFYGENNIQYDKLSYLILSRMGNLLSSKFLISLFDDGNIKETFDFGVLLNHELFSERLKRVIVNKDKILLTTDFQLKLWKSLQKTGNISISAPTSAGKSFIIQSYFSEMYFNNNSISGLYIVPTKALINQASEDLRKILKNTDVKTTFIEEDNIENSKGEKYPSKESKKKIMYVLTPERCLKLLQSAEKNKFYPNLIFVDEIQNVEDIHGRGVLLEFVLQHLSSQFSLAKIIIAGPFIKNGGEMFNELFDLEQVECKTLLSPVLQLRAIVRSKTSDNSLDIIVQDPSTKRSYPIKLDVSYNLNYELRKNKGLAFAKIVKTLSFNSQSIVYCSQTNYVESWALKLEQILPVAELSQAIEDLIIFLKEEIHPKYYLIKCLKKRIAFHHSKLPDLVRKEIENLFKNGEINVLYCTSTLLQGVNLPANNLFITSPKKRQEQLSSFEFGNLIGRAGRIKDSLYGTIFCVESDDQVPSWAEDYYSNNFEKEIISASRYMLSQKEDIIHGINNESKKEGVSHTINYLRHKFLLSPDNLKEYLNLKCNSVDYIDKVYNGIKKNLQFVEIPSELASLNPTVDPVLQDQLYKRIREEGISKWVITINSNFYKKISKDNLEKYQFEDLSFFWQLALILEKLDDIFNISHETYYKQDISLSIRSIAYFGFRWMQNRSLKDIIIDDIKFYSEKRKQIDSNDERDINKRINKVINIHSKVVTFLLVKYIKLLVDIVESLFEEKDVERYKFTLSLPVMIELGTTEPVVIQLITAGIPRSIALRIFSLFRKVKGYKELDVLQWIENESNLLGLSKVFISYLKNNNFIKAKDKM